MTNPSKPLTSEAPQEPSVLDYLKSRLLIGGSRRLEIPAPKAAEYPHEMPEPGGPLPGSDLSIAPNVRAAFPWRATLAVAMALLAQHFYEPPSAWAGAGSLLYVSALGFVLWAAWRGEWGLASYSEAAAAEDPLTFRRGAFIASLVFAVLAFLFFSGNLFTTFNLFLWVMALGLFVWSLWLRAPEEVSPGQRLRLFLSRPSWHISINRWTVLLLVATVIVVFFRVYHIQQTPAEPISDHAEKLLDVYDVSQGQTHIFFPRNTGREAIQMYWTLLVAWVFGTGFSFLSLKIGTVLIGLLTLPYIYLLGKEVAGARAGLLAFVLAGMGYWPNVISRVGLRFPLYPLFVAPVFLYLIRGLRTRQRNDFILAGIFLGLGLHGYTPFRIVPLLVIAALTLYALHAESKGARRAALLSLAIMALTALIIFLPLLRYATENPDSFSYRTLTRVGSLERPLPGPWTQIFLSNTWNALRMFNWNNGTVWVHSVPNRPALDVVTGAFFLLGLGLLLVRYWRRHHWLDLFLVASIPILLLPSILSLAFPAENPTLNRTAGALVPVFLIAALALDALMSALTSANWRPVWAWALMLGLLGASASQNFDLALRQYDQNYRSHAWNSSEMGAILKAFGQTYGKTSAAWIVPFPYWVDTRLVGIWAGNPSSEFAIWTDQLRTTLRFPGPKLFIAKASLDDPTANDQKAIDELRQLYPQGSLNLHASAVPGHEFWIYFVPSLVSP